MTVRAPLPDPLSRVRERAGVRARELRSDATDAERLLWRHLRKRQLAGCKFRRQHPVGRYFVDFACLEARLVVELDGGQHFETANAAADERRTAGLQQAGFHVMRFDNRQMLTQTGDVLAAIHHGLSAHHPHPNPLPQAGEGARDKDPSS